ncbi:MAG TPA: electron transfer flavoprotein-ubiquinone oxidoreductase, partial [Gammaproteobacteria bacterium]
VEKGAEVGAHIVSGAVIEPRGLEELFPDWQNRSAPLEVPVKSDDFYWLPNQRQSLRTPGLFVPRVMRNHGNYIASLGRVCQWLAEQAESLGCNIFPGFPAIDIIYDDAGRVCGVITGDMGTAADGSPKPTFQAGYELRAKVVVFAEGCRGSLGQQLEERYSLRGGCDPQHYGIGFKEIWTIDPAKHDPGKVVHTFGWPLDDRTEGGGFLYHAADKHVYLGFVVALNYENPHLDPFEEFQRWKQHPLIRTTLASGTRISYGARAVNKGGLQSLPKLEFPGGVLVGCEAGFLNGAKIKGSHTAIKTGMLAAESVFDALRSGELTQPTDFQSRVERSWVWQELEQARNFSPALKKLGTLLGAAFAFIEHNIFLGRLPITLRNSRPDHDSLRPASDMPRIEYPKPDGEVSFDRMSSVYLSATNHDEDQPCHLLLSDPDAPIDRNLPRYDEPAQRYCPAGVYEVVDGANGQKRFQISAQNCVHCKTCDIKDPEQNIRWVPPEGGGGPNYSGM